MDVEIMEVDDDFCTAIGLSRTDPDEPGIVRQRCGTGFTFRWPDGTVVRGPHRARCEALVLPPAWTGVWISVDADGHLQAVGTDDAGRRQYRYHDRWIEARNAEKFDHLVDVGERMARVRRAVAHDLGSDDPVTRSVAAMVRLLDRTLERIGNPESVEQFGTRGISTLGPEHVATRGTSVRLHFLGKGGTERDDVVEDRDLARVLAELERAGDDWLFSVDDILLDAADANDYLAGHSAGVIACKDVRTWGGTAAALSARIDGRSAEPQIADAASEALGNTRAVARASYVHPVVFDASDDEVEDAWRSSRRSRWYEREERAVLKLLHDAPPLLDSYRRPDSYRRDECRPDA